MQRRRVLSSLGACLGASTLAGVAGSAWAQAAAGSGAIVLGQSAPLTGPSSQLGLQFNLGAQLHFDQVNASGGWSKPTLREAVTDARSILVRANSQP